MQSRPRLAAPRPQRGAATLIVVLVLFFIVSLVAAYTSRNLIFEQRTANNQMRSTQAQETAEAGLEWALTMLNYGRVDDDCLPSTNTADQTFRQRYLLVNAEGRVTPVANPSPPVAPDPPDLTAACVFNGTDWNCACPSAGAAYPSAPTGTGPAPAFRVRFQTTVLRDIVSPTLPREPGLVRIQVVGCTRLDDAPPSAADRCLDFGREGAFNEGRVSIWHNLVLTGTSTSAPQVALLTRGGVSGTGTFSAYNTSATGSGVTVQSGGAVTGTLQLVGPAGSPGGTNTMITGDTTLSGLVDSADLVVYTKEDRMFAAVFNLRPDTFRTQQAAVEIACPGGTCSDAVVRAKAEHSAGRPLWVAGSLNMTSASDIGTPTEPVLMVVNGNVTWSVGGAGSKIHGVVYTRTPTWTTAGTGQINGAAVAESDLVLGTGSNMTFVHDTEVMQRVRWNAGTWTRLPGSWKDYEQ